MNIINKILYGFIALLLLSCNNQNINQDNYRNENYIWFEENGKKQGEWIKIDKSRESNILKDGSCKAFYANGNLREKYRLDNYGDFDTIFYYDLNENLTHYSVSADETIKNYFYNNGRFKAYLPDASLAFSGDVEDNKLINYAWHGKIKLFNDILFAQTKVWRNAQDLFKKTTDVLLERKDQKKKFIPNIKLIYLDSIRTVQMNSVDSIITSLSNYPISDNSKYLKESALDFMQFTKQLLEIDFHFLFLKMREEFTQENIKLMRNLSINILNKSKQEDIKSEEIQIQFLRSIQAGEFFLPYFEAEFNKK